MSYSQWNRPLLALLALGAVIPLAASIANGQEKMHEAANPTYLPGAAFFAVLLALCHLFAPNIRRALDKREALVGSFGGGMAIGYVFVHLLPELDTGHALLGEMIFLIALAGFVAYYGFETLIHVRPAGSSAPGARPSDFYLQLTLLWVYNWLIVYSLPAQHLKSGWSAVPIALALCIHLLHKDYQLGRQYPQLLNDRGRYILALAPITGWLTALMARSHDEAIDHIFVALLAGSVLYGVFREELPGHEASRFPAFALGVLVFLAVALVAGLA